MFAYGRQGVSDRALRISVKFRFSQPKFNIAFGVNDMNGIKTFDSVIMASFQYQLAQNGKCAELLYTGNVQKYFPNLSSASGLFRSVDMSCRKFDALVPIGRIKRVFSCLIQGYLR